MAVNTTAKAECAKRAAEQWPHGALAAAPV